MHVHKGYRAASDEFTAVLLEGDAAHSESEERWFTLGLSTEGTLLEKVRIISARPATRRERDQYENEPR
jgi:uncharacterized DUF497 family protein